MTFAALPPHDYPAIARAIAAERRAKPAPDLRGLTGDARAEARRAVAEDPHIWRGVVEWADWIAARPRPARMPGGPDGMAEADFLAAVTLRTATAALRKWHADGQPRGEPEARAFLMLNLADAFARLTRQPIPTCAALIAAQPERKAA